MNLYEIANEYQIALNESFDPETGELNEEAILRIESIQDDVKNKSIAVASFIRGLEAERDAIADAEARMHHRAKVLANKMSYLSNYLQSNMEQCGITEIKCPYFVIKIKKCPLSTDVLDESAIPEEYKKRKEVISVDKNKVKEDILSGIEVPGAIVKQNIKLEIK